MRMLLSILLLSSVSLTPLLADAKRADTWQIALTPHYTSAQKLHYKDGQYLDLSSRTGWGFGVGYNFNEHIGLDLNFNSSSGGSNANINDENGTAHQFSNSFYSSSVDLEATYNIIDGPFTPYLSASIGSTFVDSGMATGDLYYGCGYYYYCGYYKETYTAVRFNAGAGLGLRYDFENMLYLKGGVKGYWVDYNTENTPYFIDYQLSVGMKFK